MDAFRGQFTLPRLERVIAGPATLDALPEELDRYRCRRAIVVTGTTVAASPMLEVVRERLQHRCVGVFTGVRQHVPRVSVDALLRLAAEAAADALVSLGGGSAIDTVKGAVHARLGVPSERLPVHIALPTTLSAGEFTDVAGITDESTRIKHAVAHPALAPRTVIADPLLTRETPGQVWAASGIRALDHAIETLYSARRHPLSEPLAARAIEMIVAHLPPSLTGDDDERLAHRGHCQMAAWLAVFGVTNAGFGLSHVAGHQIGPRWNVLHGITSAIVLPHAMRFMASEAPGRFGSIARSLGLAFDPENPRPAALETAGIVAGFVSGLGLPARLRDVGVPADELGDIAVHIAGVMQRSGVVERAISAEDVRTLLMAAY